jgi:hypothetical protein
MQRRTSLFKAGLVLGLALGGWHFCWAALVAPGLARSVINFIFRMHFIKSNHVVEPFEAARAAILLPVTSALGLSLGALFAAIWDAVLKN